ncbi:hypothetical protein EV702DRAFT_1192952 [Suillus placidus]|uniref:Uncharacterized protein n=1 Tax=Suillus placidus TaxID=48579 RepID=A0A9P7A327_9AGAM|nr:hypothetical protein EV702DRAFT_1192952 [Suillus placidus]
MTSHPAVRFDDPPVTDYNSMDVDESFVSQASLDELYLRPDDDIEYDSVSSRPPGVLAAISNQSPLAQSDHPGLPINPDLYLGPEDDLIDVDELLDFPDVKGDALAPAEELMLSNEKSAELHAAQPYLTNEELHLMLQEFQPFNSYEHTGLQSIQDWLSDYKHRDGNLPDPSIQQLLEVERPFQMAWAKTSDKLKKADADLQRLQRAERMSI